FSYLNVEVLHVGEATWLRFASRNGPVGGEPPKHDPTVEELADGMDMLRGETPVDDPRTLHFLQGVDERCRRSSRVEHGVPCGRQSVSVEHPSFFDIEVQESLLLFEPPAE